VWFGCHTVEGGGSKHAKILRLGIKPVVCSQSNTGRVTSCFVHGVARGSSHDKVICGAFSGVTCEFITRCMYMVYMYVHMVVKVVSRITRTLKTLSICCAFAKTKNRGDTHWRGCAAVQTTRRSLWHLRSWFVSSLHTNCAVHCKRVGLPYMGPMGLHVCFLLFVGIVVTG